MRRHMVAVTAGMIVAAGLGGWGQEQRHQDAGEPAAARAVVAITRDGPAAAAQVPADFATVMGYRPAVLDPGGRAVPTRADGGCTSPFGATAFGFGEACRQHDLGYDLLRYAGAKGRPLPPWARRAVDDRFAHQLRAGCHDPACLVMAAGYSATVRLNSWRQGWGVPVVERVRSVLPAVLAGIATALLLGSARGWRLLTPVLPGRTGQVLVAAAALALAVQPGSLPRPLWVQVLIGGLAAAQAYAVASFLRWAALRVLGVAAGRPARLLVGPVTCRAPRTELRGVGVLLAVAALTGHAGQARLAEATGVASPTLAGSITATLLAVIVAAAAVGLPALLGAGAGRLLGRAGRRVTRGRWRGRAAAVLLAPALGLTGCTTVVPGPFTGADLPSAPTQGDTLGVKGRQFIAATPTAAAISARTGRPALAPLRLYVGRHEAATANERAALAVRDLDRAGAFERSVLLIAVPTGSGWVNPAPTRALEFMHGGDMATVAVQYAASPSWLTYLRGGEGAQRSVRSLLDDVAARVSRQPAGHRPRVLLYGESLGAWGGLTAYPDPHDVGRRADGALWVGVPAGTPTVDPARYGEAADRIRTFAHSDDPVPAWSPRLLFQPSRAWPHQWLPLVTFWQVTGDVIAAPHAPSGHGHRYGAEVIDAWRDLAAPAAGRDGHGAAGPAR